MCSDCCARLACANIAAKTHSPTIAAAEASFFFMVSVSPRTAPGNVREYITPREFGSAAFASDSDLGKDDPLLRLVFALLVLVGDFAHFVGFEENHLGKTFVRVNL